jgi:hypothetical protein
MGRRLTGLFREAGLTEIAIEPVSDTLVRF